MARTVYVNSAYVDEGDAGVSVFDRGFLMADGVYEVTGVLNGKLIEFPAHMARLTRSLNALDIKNPHTIDKWLEIHEELVKVNAVENGLVYLQVTRGSYGDRDFAYLPNDVSPTVVLFTQRKRHPSQMVHVQSGIRVISMPDLRWGRRDVKTIQLLYPSMAKMEAIKRGADDAWLVEDGFVTEGTASNAFILKDKCLITRPRSERILHGVARQTLLNVAEDCGLTIDERPFTIAEAIAADEAFYTSSFVYVVPVIEIDSMPIGSGAPGAVTMKLHQAYLDLVSDTASAGQST